jgi:hypothetical protein
VLSDQFVFLFSGEYINSEFEELIEWINATVPVEASFAGKFAEDYLHSLPKTAKSHFSCFYVLSSLVIYVCRCYSCLIPNEFNFRV